MHGKGWGVVSGVPSGIVLPCSAWRRTALYRLVLYCFVPLVVVLPCTAWCRTALYLGRGSERDPLPRVVVYHILFYCLLPSGGALYCLLLYCRVLLSAYCSVRSARCVPLCA